MFWTSLFSADKMHLPIWRQGKKIMRWLWVFRFVCLFYCHGFDTSMWLPSRTAAVELQSCPCSKTPNFTVPHAFMFVFVPHLFGSFNCHLSSVFSFLFLCCSRRHDIHWASIGVDIDIMLEHVSEGFSRSLIWLVVQLKCGLLSWLQSKVLTDGPCCSRTSSCVAIFL